MRFNSILAISCLALFFSMGSRGDDLVFDSCNLVYSKSQDLTWAEPLQYTFNGRTTSGDVFTNGQTTKSYINENLRRFHCNGLGERWRLPTFPEIKALFLYGDENLGWSRAEGNCSYTPTYHLFKPFTNNVEFCAVTFWDRGLWVENADGIRSTVTGLRSPYHAKQTNGYSAYLMFVHDGRLVDADSDKDGVADSSDNCPDLSNPSQRDYDGDSIGDECDIDDDNDSVSDDIDNCPYQHNLAQEDSDDDGFGDACDSDDDNDGVNDEDDNCPNEFNPDQLNTDGVGRGDACNADDDVDGDDWEDSIDNCPLVANSIQSDFDGDGLGDDCDGDVDGDGVAKEDDNCPLTESMSIVSADGCTLSQSCPCDAPKQVNDKWRNHGAYVSCVSRISAEMLMSALISVEIRQYEIDIAAQSSCGQ